MGPITEKSQWGSDDSVNLLIDRKKVLITVYFLSQKTDKINFNLTFLLIFVFQVSSAACWSPDHV